MMLPMIKWTCLDFFRQREEPLAPLLPYPSPWIPVSIVCRVLSHAAREDLTQSSLSYVCLYGSCVCNTTQWLCTLFPSSTLASQTWFQDRKDHPVPRHPQFGFMDSCSGTLRLYFCSGFYNGQLVFSKEFTVRASRIIPWRSPSV